ncbi:ATP-binding SpoIIE family protein phosphatase [Streptomyces mirabilis]|uniref:ATP-binding SpoIIE family protein phosphatase n=1 Tax=Streptomyces mirabilis TaxID=68239 RepID=UPI0036C51A87
MDKDSSASLGRRSPLLAVCAAVLDREGTVIRWSSTAADLLGRTAQEVCGRPVQDLLAEAPRTGTASCAGQLPAEGIVRLRLGSGGAVDVDFRVVALDGSADGYVVVAAPADTTGEWEIGGSFLRALLAQDQMGIAIHDTQMNVVRTNIRPEMFEGPPLQPDIRLKDVVIAEDAEMIELLFRKVMETGVPFIRKRLEMHSSTIAGHQWDLSVSAFRLQDIHGDPSGIAVTVNDTTAQQRVRRQMDLLHEAALRIGSSLDVVRTAQELADVLVPELGDLTAVDISDSVLVGDEPWNVIEGMSPRLVRVATSSRTGDWPSDLPGPGKELTEISGGAHISQLRMGQAVTLDREAMLMAPSSPGPTERFSPILGHPMTIAPLLARGRLLGTVSVWRTERPDPLDEAERILLTEIASRAALGVDNARRYTREHRAATALQERLLPRAETDTPGLETAGIYHPAAGGADIGGDWFDAIPLPSLRVALVIGDVIGHGLSATATMGRLRTAIQTFADLELDPAEVLTHVEDLVQRLAAEIPSEQWDAVGATCLYAVYDPITGKCTLASAGQPPPVVVGPDGTARYVEVSPGPPLGVGGVPFESTTVTLEAGSVLTLYTDGLFELEGFDSAHGMTQLRNRLAVLTSSGRGLADIGRDLIGDLTDRPTRDDVALLLARTRVISKENTASWQFPAEPTSVADARKVVTRQLELWGLDELSISTELVVSELVTNAIRYAGGPVGLRLIRENVLICEVADPSNTQPRLLRAAATDEGGRGLFIVAKCTSRWGSRYSQKGKTIWTEQPLEGLPDQLAPLFDLTEEELINHPSLE